MKKTITFILLTCSVFLINAQNIDPDFFNQTWYLHEVYDSDLDEYFYVEGYQPYGGQPTIPQIAPRVLIETNFDYSGVGICNTFEGTLEEDPVTGNLRATAATVTANACGFFEDEAEPYIIGPFGYVDPDPTLHTLVDILITNQTDGFQTMTYTTQPFVTYTYRNTPVLAIPEATKLQFSVYPNPTADIVIFRGNTMENTKVRMLSARGSFVLESEISNAQPSIDISALPSGLYFAEITSQKGREIHKLLKR